MREEHAGQVWCNALHTRDGEQIDCRMREESCDRTRAAILHGSAEEAFAPFVIVAEGPEDLDAAPAGRFA